MDQFSIAGLDQFSTAGDNKKQLCVVREIKVSFKENEDLKKMAKEVAIAQIDRNQYGKLYQEKYGYKILKLGIAFRGDNFALAYEVQNII